MKNYSKSSNVNEDIAPNSDKFIISTCRRLQSVVSNLVQVQEVKHANTKMTGNKEFHSYKVH